MLVGLQYGIWFFSVIPLLVFALNSGDLTFFSKDDYFAKQYSLTFGVAYSLALIFITLLAVTVAANKLPPIETSGVSKSVYRLRKQSIVVWLITCVAYTSAVMDFFYIDHNVYWLERETIKFLPPSLSFYLSPIINFSVFLSIINIAFSATSIKIRSFLTLKGPGQEFFVVSDVAFLGLTIYNTGNRWYIALAAVLFFLAASSRTKRLLLLFTPFIFLIGSLVSILVLASRVNQDPFVLFEYFAPQNFLNALSMSALFVTEGLSLGALFEVAGTTLLSPDLGYLVGRLVTFPFPGSLIDKLPPFNIQAAALIYGQVTEHSINTTLLGIFVYSFGVLAIPVIPYVVFLIYKLDRRIHRKYGNVARILFFCLAFAGFRFNFEFFVVHVIYFLLLATVLKRNLIRIDRGFGTFRTSSRPQSVNWKTK